MYKCYICSDNIFHPPPRPLRMLAVVETGLTFLIRVEGNAPQQVSISYFIFSQYFGNLFILIGSAGVNDLKFLKSIM